jgi:hypothetical protein
MGESEMTDINEKMSAKQYIEALRDLRQRIDPETFISANNYIQAAVNVTGAFDFNASWSTIQSTTELALRLFELYPESMPLTFAQLAQMQEKGFSTPPPDQMPDWWAGRI